VKSRFTAFSASHWATSGLWHHHTRAITPEELAGGLERPLLVETVFIMSFVDVQLGEKDEWILSSP
jgi:hypothetical protein